jgi:hypothetical protein
LGHERLLALTMLLCECPVLKNHLADQEGLFALSSGNRRPTPRGKPFRDHSVVFGATGRRVKRAQVNLLAAECHDSSAAGFVESIGQEFVSETWHMRSLLEMPKR